MSDFVDPNPQWLNLYNSLGIPISEAFSDPQRRRIDGTILSADGMLGIATGGCSIMFDKAVASVMIGDMSNPIAIPYETMVSLQFTGRGQITTTTGGGWVGGGYGLTGAFHGAAMARAMNMMTTKTITTNETIVLFEWRGGQITLLNTTFLPMQMATFLQPVVARISAFAQQVPAPVEVATSPNASDFTQQLTSLTELHASGALTDEEFTAAKARLLSS